MRNQSGVTSSPSTPTLNSLSILFRNIRLLDLTRRDDWPDVSLEVFTSKDDPHNRKLRIQCVEWILYRLWQIWDQEECRDKLQPFFPPLEPLQSINLRAALFRCLNDLKKNGVLGRDINIRKSMFDECKGDMLPNVLSVFSTKVLQKTLSAEEVGRSCIVGRLCADAQRHLGDHSSMLPLSIAHKASLTHLLQKKHTLKTRYRDFSQSLQDKDSKLLNKFDKVVETQIYLDKNPPSEDTVERVSRVLDQYWQGDHKQIDVIAQGEEHRLTDALLDHRFEAVWQRVNIGSFDGDISTGKDGLLRDLEKRVAMQKARLQRWHDVKSEMEQKKQSNAAMTPTSPVKKPLSSPHSYRYEQRKGKDLVFSPQKSPRKSMQPSGPPVDVLTLEESGYPLVSTEPKLPTPLSIISSSSDVMSSPLAAKSSTLCLHPREALFSNNGVGGEDNNSDFSEVSITAGTSPKTSNAISLSPRMNEIKGHSLSTSKFGPFRDTESGPPKNTKESFGQMDGQNGMTITDKPGKVDILAEPVFVCTADTNQLPAQQKLPLIERTRQSMAFTNPKAGLPLEESTPLISLPTPQPKPAIEDFNVRATLAERTRQSISLLPAKPKRSRESSHNWRMSKTYPTNQFETPKRQNPIAKMTPPEELMSPGAGYDSVFKSRPKVAFSPPTSPVPYGETGGKVPVDNNHVET